MRVSVLAMRRRGRLPLAIGVVVAVVCIVAETVLADFLMQITSAHAAIMVYLLGVAVVVSVWGFWLGFAVSFASALAFSYVIISPMWSLRLHKLSDITAPLIFIFVALLICVLSVSARSVAVEADARQEADLSAELARLLLRGPDLPTSLAAAAKHLRQRLDLPWASIEPGEVPPGQGQEAYVLRGDGTPATLLIPAGVTRPTLQRLYGRILPALEVLLQAAGEREHTAQALKTSRARVIATADETRRRIGRDLHDGTQQRLVSIGLELRNIRAKASPELEPLLARTARSLDETLTELCEISRGLHPPILTQGGIRPALTALARRCPITVNLKVSTPQRLPEGLEITIYYVASEALTNVAKHAHASSVDIDLTSNAIIRLSIRDDGVGGADPSRGSGLIGLLDRIEALDGRLEILSPASGGTELHVEFPSAHDRRAGSCP